MTAFLITLFKLSLAASLLIGAVALFRVIFRRAPKWIRGVLWAMVALRLLVPFFPESPISAVPRGIASISEEVITERAAPQSAVSAYTAPAESPSAPADDPAIRTAAAAPAATSSAAQAAPSAQTQTPTALAAEPETPAASAPDLFTVLFTVWAAGAAGMIVYGAVTRALFRRRIRASVPLGDGVWASDYVSSPFVLGVIRPRIYVPSTLCGDELERILRHERAHVSRRDDLWKMIGFLILSAYWFCPAAWIGYILFCRDIEYSCDERAMRGTDAEYRAAYSRTLVDFGVRSTPVAGPLGFGRLGVKRRVKNVLNYKKPALWIVIAAFVLCAVIGVLFLTAPRTASAPYDVDAVAGEDSREEGSVSDPETAGPETERSADTGEGSGTESAIVSEPATESATEPATEPATEAATESATEAATESATESATEPATEPATESATEAATEPATESATEAATEPVVEIDDASLPGKWEVADGLPDVLTVESVRDGKMKFTLDVIRYFRISGTAVKKGGEFVFGDGVTDDYSGPGGMKGKITRDGGKLVLTVTDLGVHSTDRYLGARLVGLEFPTYTPLPETVVTAYDDVAARVHGDRRYRFVKGFLDRSSAEVYRALYGVYFDESNERAVKWTMAYGEFMKSFTVSDWSCTEGGVNGETLVFEFNVSESSADAMPVGRRVYELRYVYAQSDLYVTDRTAEEKDAALRATLPSDAKLLWVDPHSFRWVVENYENWGQEEPRIYYLFHSLPDRTDPNGDLRMTVKEAAAAARELFGIDYDMVPRPVSPRDTVEDLNPFRCVETEVRKTYHLIEAGKTGTGYRVVYQTYSDYTSLLPSDVVEVLIKPGTRLYDWVFEDIRLVKRGDLSPE